MPHSIIHKLRALQAMDFPSLLGTPHQYLNKGKPPIPEAALELVDGIIDDACRIMGTRVRPNAQQLRTMADHGYMITFDGAKTGEGLPSGVIHCPKGLINYF